MTRRDPAAAAALAQALALASEMTKGGDELQRLVHLLKPLVDELRIMTGVLPGMEGAGAPADCFPAFWEAFWEGSPVKVGKIAAERAARRARTRPDWPGDREVLQARDRQKETPRWRQGTIPNPETWFNQGRYLDDPATMSAIGNGNGRQEERPPAGYLFTRCELQGWPGLSRNERRLLLENIAAEHVRRRRLQAGGDEEYTTT
jgi:hypothetical protein